MLWSAYASSSRKVSKKCSASYSTSRPWPFRKPTVSRDHREVFLQRNLEDLGDVQRPGLADDRDRGRLRVEQQAHLHVLLHAHAAAAGHAKGGDLRVLPGALRGLREEGLVPRIRPRPAALDVVDAEFIELLGDANLIEHAERNARPLRAVAEGGVVDRDSWRAHVEKGSSLRGDGGFAKRLAVRGPKG